MRSFLGSALVGIAASVLLTATAVGAPASAASVVCVGGPGCAATVQAAVDAAQPGDTIRIAAGTFKGGVTIDKSLTIVGAGEHSTVIRGGNSVFTILPKDTPTVSFVDLGIVGGVAHGSDDIRALGGGINAPALGGASGASLVLRHVAVVGNRAVPTKTTSSQTGAECTGGECPFALAAGGGIATNGDLVIDHSVVADNAATGSASDADGGGVWSDGGKVTVIDSAVSGNQAVPVGIGRFAEGGGLFVNDGALSVRDSAITGNTAKLVTHWPVHGDDGSVINMGANSGGIHIGDDVDAIISGTMIDHNHVTAVDPTGEPASFDGGILEGDSTLALTSSSVSHNSVENVAATAVDVGLSGDALEFDGPGTMNRVRIVGNTAVASSPSADAAAGDGLAVYDFSSNPRQVTGAHVTITGNTATASAPHGPAIVTGAGVLNNSLLTLRDSVVSLNHGLASGSDPTAQGGGIWNGVLLSGPPVTLVLDHVSITHNAVSAPGGAPQGGGIYSTSSFTAHHVLDTGNAPDECAGSGC